MSEIEESLREHLLAVPAIAGLIATRMYPIVLPQGTELPAVTYQRVSTPELFGWTNGMSGITRAKIQVSVWATQWTEARDISRLIRSLLAGDRGRWGSLVVGRCMFTNAVDLYVPETRIHHVAMDFEVLAEEAA